VARLGEQLDHQLKDWLTIARGRVRDDPDDDDLISAAM
jgi:hypothetical protein